MSTQYHSHKKRKDYDYEDLSISYDYGEIDNGCCCCRDSLLLLLLLSFFYKWKLLLKSRMFILVEINGSQSFKDIPYSCYWTPIFSIFFQIFFKAEAVFPYNGNVFINILSRLVQTGFLPSGNSIFWSVLFRC